MPTEAEVISAISRILANETEITAEVTPSSHLLRDLQLDSLSLTVLAVGLEDQYRIRLTEEDTVGIDTVSQLAALVIRRVQEVKP